jgi:hypothetical protein
MPIQLINWFCTPMQHQGRKTSIDLSPLEPQYKFQGIQHLSLCHLKTINDQKVDEKL